MAKVPRFIGPMATRPGLGIAEGNFVSKSYPKSLKNYQMKARAVPPPCRGFKKLKNTRVWTGPPRKRQHYRGFWHGPGQMPRGSATFFFEVLSLRAVGLSFVASADIYVVFWGSFSTWPCKVPCFLGPIATRVCSGAVKHVLPATLGGLSAAFSRSDCDPGRGGCPGGLQEAPGVAGGRPEAAGGPDFDPV